MSRKKLSLLILILLCFSGLFFIKPVLSRLAVFLSATGRVSGNAVIIEGWLPYEDLKYAIEEVKKSGARYIFTTGLKSTPKYYNINTDGYLIFQTARFLKNLTDKGMHSISVRASSELAGENSAHFNLWINDSLAADFSADRRRRKYTIQWKGALSDIDSVMIQFDNDLVSESGDRNLFVRDLIFDKKVKIPFLNNSVYDISALDNKNRIVNDMHSNAEMTAKRLVAMGVDPGIVIAVPGKKVRINRTLTSALAVRDWLRENPAEITGINVVSAGTHSRRTWMTFSRILPVNVGIIALPDSKIRYKGDIRIRKTLRETIAFIYYWIILIPYCS